MKKSTTNSQMIQSVPALARLTQLEQQLEEKNEQFEHFSFLTSHRLRASLARILGLVSLTDLNVDQADLNKTILHLLKVEAQAMDEIVEDMNEQLSSSKLKSEADGFRVKACA